MNTTEKLEAFRAHLEFECMRGLIAQGYILTLDIHPHACRVELGNKYAKVDVGGPHWSGRYMVDLATEEIFGIKGYGVIHRGHQYGTLDTINDFDWSGYTAVRKAKVAA